MKIARSDARAKTRKQFLDIKAQKIPESTVRIRGTHKESWIEDGLRYHGIKEECNLTVFLQEQLANPAYYCCTDMLQSGEWQIEEQCMMRMHDAHA